MEQLRRLDRSATRKGTVVSVIVGVISCLLLGIGMCCTMVWMHRVEPPAAYRVCAPKMAPAFSSLWAMMPSG